MCQLRPKLKNAKKKIPILLGHDKINLDLLRYKLNSTVLYESIRKRAANIRMDNNLVHIYSFKLLVQSSSKMLSGVQVYPELWDD